MKGYQLPTKGRLTNQTVQRQEDGTKQHRPNLEGSWNMEQKQWFLGEARRSEIGEGASGTNHNVLGARSFFVLWTMEYDLQQQTRCFLDRFCPSQTLSTTPYQVLLLLHANS
jgi:hypothetical protein